MLSTAGIAKDKKNKIHLAPQQTSQFYNQPAAASCQSSASNRFPQLTSSGTLACCFIGTVPCVILELCVFECCWILVSKLVLASLSLQRTGMCPPQVTHLWSWDQLQRHGLQRAPPVTATAHRSLLCDSCACWLSCKLYRMTMTCLVSSGCSRGKW